MFVCPVPKISQVMMKRRRQTSHLGRFTLWHNGRRNFWKMNFWKIQPTQIDSRPSANSWNMYTLRRQNKRPQQTLEWWTQRTQESPSEYSSTSRKAPGYRLSPDHFQTVKQMLAPDWAQKMLCIIVPNRRTASPDFFSCVRTRRLLSRRTIYTTATAPKTSLF